MTTTHSKTKNNTTSPPVPEPMSERVSDSIENATARIVDVVEEKGSALAEGAHKLVGDASDKARYLRDTEPKRLGADLLALVKRHPVVSLAIGASLGLLVSRRRRRRR